jgi:hypothetical protein
MLHEKAASGHIDSAIKLGWSIPRITELYNYDRARRNMSPVDEIDDSEILEVLEQRKIAQRAHQKDYQQRQKARARNGDAGAAKKLGWTESRIDREVPGRSQRYQTNESEQDDVYEVEMEDETNDAEELPGGEDITALRVAAQGFLNRAVLTAHPYHPAPRTQTAQTNAHPRTYPMHSYRDNAYTHGAVQFNRSQNAQSQSELSYWSGQMAVLSPDEQAVATFQEAAEDYVM